MPFRIIFTPAARADLHDALDWYSEHAPGIVPRIRVELRGLYSRIAANPLQFPAKGKNTRHALIPHIPYAVIFRVAGDAVHVVAIFHTSRDPREWQRRT